MEKDSKESRSDNTVNENTEDVENFDDLLDNLLEERRQLQLSEEKKKLKQTLEENIRRIRLLEDLLSPKITSQFLPLDKERPVSPMASPIHKPHNSLEDTFENFPYPAILVDCLKNVEVIYDPKETLHQSSIKESSVISPPKSSGNETKADEIGANFNSLQGSMKSEKPDDGKGKEAANPKFRYKKRSKPEVSSTESPSQGTPVKPSKEESDAKETLTLQSQSSKLDITRISPSVKRKELDYDESSSTGIIKFSGNRADDNDDLKIAKKLKFDDEEKPSIQCPTITTLVSGKDYEPSNSSENIDQSLTEQSRIESENLALPSTSGESKVVSYASSSEESFVFIENDVPCSEREESSSLTSGSEDVPQSETRESSLTTVSDLSELFGSLSEGSLSDTEKS